MKLLYVHSGDFLYIPACILLVILGLFAIRITLAFIFSDRKNWDELWPVLLIDFITWILAGYVFDS